MRSRLPPLMPLLLAAGLGLGPANSAPILSPDTWYPHQLTRTEPARLPGPFLCDSLAFFVVHHGGPLTLALEVRRPSCELADNGGIRLPHAIFWQVYDAEERLVEQRYHKFVDDSDVERAFQVKLQQAPAGVYQVRYAKSQGNGMTVDLRTEPVTSFAVMPCRARLQGTTRDQFADAYVYSPPGCKEATLHTYACTVSVEDLAGAVMAETKGKPSVKVAIDSDRTYRIGAAFAWDGGAFGITGIPPILCPDEITARNIRGSLEVAPDGRVLAHKFQVRMWQWMHALTPGDLAVDPVPLAPLRDEWLKEPRNAGLLGIGGPFNHIARILRDQDLDPDSDTYGLGTCTSWLGPAYVIDAPLNPYRRNRAILNRILLYEFTCFLKLAENGTLNASNWDHYSGGDGLGYRQRASQFGYVAPLVEAPVRDLWFEGAAKVLSRWAFSRVSCENQTSHWMLDLFLLYQGSGRDVYKTLAHDFAAAFYDPDLNAFMRTGYQQERYGPDATYNGLCACNQAIYYKYSGDEAAKRGLQRTYDLFNHTVAPEPDGRVFGASNFSHRTSGSWVNRQYNAGLNLMSDELPEAGVWYPEKADAAACRTQALERIETGLATNWDDAWYERNMRWLSTYAYHPWTAFFHLYTFPLKKLVPGTWPVLRSDRFFRNVNNEFVFVRTPQYYAAVYTGSTMHEWVKASRKPLPLIAGWKEVDGVLEPTTANAKKLVWQPTQGLSLFWTPDAGNLVLGKNWNVYTGQFVRADVAEDRVSWPDYWEFSHECSEAARTLVLRSRMVDLPLAVERRMTFEDGGLRQDVELVAEGSVGVRRLVQQVPYLKKDGVVALYHAAGTWSPTVDGPCDAVWIGNAGGPGLAVELSQPQRVRHGPESRAHGHTMALLEIELLPHLTEGERLTLSYGLRPCRQPALP